MCIEEMRRVVEITALNLGRDHTILFCSKGFGGWYQIDIYLRNRTHSNEPKSKIRRNVINWGPTITR